MGDAKDIYNSLYTFIKEPHIRAKKIDLMMLEEYLKSSNIEYKKLEKDTRLLPAIKEINAKFKDSFNLINKNLIDRENFNTCFDFIDNGLSLVVHGKAGMGKSGCVLSIAKYCENNNIPYIGIKLDKYTPKIGDGKWSELLVLPDTLANCVNAISKNRRAVIILDQIYALLWTLAHSSIAIDVCHEIIREIEQISKNR